VFIKSKILGMSYRKFLINLAASLFLSLSFLKAHQTQKSAEEVLQAISNFVEQSLKDGFSISVNPGNTPIKNKVSMSEVLRANSWSNVVLKREKPAPAVNIVIEKGAVKFKQGVTPDPKDISSAVESIEIKIRGNRAGLLLGKGVTTNIFTHSFNFHKSSSQLKGEFTVLQKDFRSAMTWGGNKEGFKIFQLFPMAYASENKKDIAEKAIDRALSTGAVLMLLNVAYTENISPRDTIMIEDLATYLSKE
jgi:hypothetical protein